MPLKGFYLDTVDAWRGDTGVRWIPVHHPPSAAGPKRTNGVSRTGSTRRLVWRTVLSLALAAVAAAFGLHVRTDLAIYDAFSLVRMALCPADARGLPVIVAIDGAALREYGRWPWHRRRLARLVRLVNAGEPSAVGLDLLLAEPGPGDSELISAIRGGRVILAERLDLRRAGPVTRSGRPEPPLPPMAAAARGAGFIDFFPDLDGVARRMPVRYLLDGEERLSLAAALARAAGEPPAGTFPPEVDLLIGLRREAWRTVSAADVLAGRADPALWRGRSVLIGLTAPGVSADSYRVAVGAMGDLPGVYLHAYAYATLARWGAVRPLSRTLSYLLILALSAGLALPARGGRLWRMAGTMAGFAVAVMLGALVLFLGRWWWAPSLPLAALGLTGAAHLLDAAAESRRREQGIRKAFAKYVSPEVLREILAGPEPVLGGEAREITVLFADLRGFTALAEGRPPDLVAAELNSHLGLMSQAILEAGGMVDKFMGDAVMGIFGAPLPQADHRRRALTAAAAIRELLNRPGFLPPGIGLASGRALVGNTGSPDRLAYTAVGDLVNLAARLEELAGPNEILAAGCFSGGAPDPGWEPLGEIRLRGRESPVMVYRSVMGVTDQPGLASYH